MTLMTLFLFCIALGGVLIGASLFLGDADQDVDTDVDLDADVDADADLEADSTGGGFAMSVLPFASIRFWTFLIEAFGLTGALLSLAGFAPGIVIGVSLATGLCVGWGAFAFFRMLVRDQVSGAVSLAQYRDTEARVLVRVPEQGLGKIVIDALSGQVELMAQTMDGSDIPNGARVLVIGVKNGVADVTSLTPGQGADRVTQQSDTAPAPRQPATERQL